MSTLIDIQDTHQIGSIGTKCRCSYKVMNHNFKKNWKCQKNVQENKLYSGLTLISE